MNKKIVVVTGSPRRNGNSFAMTDAFISAAQAMGHDVVRFDAAMMKIGGCHACGSGIFMRYAHFTGFFQLFIHFPTVMG